MALCGKVRDRVRKFFNPDGFESRGFRDTLLLGMMALCLGELVVFILLRRSAELGELPYYITDALIIGISSLEFLLCWFIGWLGSLRRRTMIVFWFLLVLACAVAGFALPGTETIEDAGLCSVAVPRSLPLGISTRAAVRLSLLLIFGLSCALGRLAIMAHGLAYMDEHNPLDNTHMHVGCFLLHRVVIILVGHSIMKPFTVETSWLQFLAISVKCLITLLRLFRFPVSAPAVEKELGSDRNAFRSVGRVLGSGVAMLQIIAMALLAAGLWGFGVHDVAFSKESQKCVAGLLDVFQFPLLDLLHDLMKKVFFILTDNCGYVHCVLVKYHMKENEDNSSLTLKIPTIVFGVVLAGFTFTAPVMPKYDRKAVVRNAILMSLLTTLIYVVMTHWGGCNRGVIAGLGEQSYSQPACGLNCGCDRPWMEYTPVCVHEQMTTYFSPCHAGCGMADTVNNVGVYSNCTCAVGARVSVGACDDGTCAEAHELHEMRFILAVLTSTLAMTCQGAVLIQSVDRRDVSVAVGLASGVVSLFTFVGAHGFYLGISSLTCAFNRGSKCLLHKESFVPWVGYSSTTLAGISALFSIITLIVLKCQKEKKEEEEEDFTLS